MGYSIRTLQWRYTCWYHWDKSNLQPFWDGEYVDELYDHSRDDSTNMDIWENENLSVIHHDVATRLKGKLEAFFRYGKEDDEEVDDIDTFDFVSSSS